MAAELSTKRSVNKLRSRGSTLSHAQRSSQSHIQLSAKPDFALTEAYLTQCAADALKDHPAYSAIEKETLNAVAPFADLHKKEKEKEKSSQETADAPAAALATTPEYKTHKQEDSSSTDNSSSSNFQSRHHKTSSASSMSFEDFRKYVQTVPHLPFSIPENSNASKSLRRMTSGGINPYLQPGLPNDANLLEYSRALSQREAELEDLQKRLRSYSLGSAQPLSFSPGAPDSAFTLTKFVKQSVAHFMPSGQEIDEKCRLKKEIESILQSIQPTAQLVVFGSAATGLALTGSDMDLMVMDTSEDQLHDLEADMPGLLFEALRVQGYAVKLLSKARIPLVKIQREYIGTSFSIDICFNNPLALHNTRLIATYAACDSRLPALLMFVKLWAKARKINDAYNGTLKSYGYMLLLIYYLQNKVVPPLLPNLQLTGAGPSRKISVSELECNGFNIWFFKDVEKIIPVLQQNDQSIGELLEGFLGHFAYEFDYRDWVCSIRLLGGLQTKDAKNWTQMIEHLNERGDAKVKDRYILSIEDPFELTHNVARTVTRAGLYEMRGEFMHAVRSIRGNKLTDLLY